MSVDFWIPEKLPYEFQKGRFVDIKSKGEYEVGQCHSRSQVRALKKN